MKKTQCMNIMKYIMAKSLLKVGRFRIGSKFTPFFSLIHIDNGKCDFSVEWWNRQMEFLGRGYKTKEGILRQCFIIRNLTWYSLCTFWTRIYRLVSFFDKNGETDSLKIFYTEMPAFSSWAWGPESLFMITLQLESIENSALYFSLHPLVLRYIFGFFN